MLDIRARDNIAKTAHLTAGMRMLGRMTDGDSANADYLAERFLLPYQRWMARAPYVSRWVLERLMPGAFGYFNARTRYFDEILSQVAASGLEQLVLLGAGFDSRPYRFAKELSGVRVFEVDMPQVLGIRAERLQGIATSTSTVPVPIDFERDDLRDVLVASGYVTQTARTLFLWEGVSYYLPAAAVDSVLASVAALTGPGSSLLFDYVTRAFFDGDHRGYGAKLLARGWRSMGNVNRSGIADVSALVQPHGFRVRSEVDAEELERRYLYGLAGGVRKAWGVMRVALAERV